MAQNIHLVTTIVAIMAILKNEIYMDPSRAQLLQLWQFLKKKKDTVDS